MNKEALHGAEIECFASCYIPGIFNATGSARGTALSLPQFASSMAATKELIEIFEEVHLVRVSNASPSPLRSPSLSSVVVHDWSVLYKNTLIRL